MMEVKKYIHEKPVNNLIPHPCRILLVGASGSGKTNLLMNFIYNQDGIVFKHLYVFSRSLEQPAYIDLQEHYREIENKLGKKIAFFFRDSEDLIPLEECERNSLVVFDDCLMDNQEKIKNYFIRGRHKKISCIYLSQSYGKVDMQVIRNNLNFLCIFAQNKYYTRRIYNDFVGSDMTFEEFEKMCDKCWQVDYGFITIDMTKKLNSGKYKCMLKEILKR